MWLNTVQLGSCRWFAQFVVTRATAIGVVHRKDKKEVSSSCVWGGMPCWCQRSDWADWVITTGYNQRQHNIYVYCVYMLKRTHRSLVIKIYVTANVLACFNTFPHSFWMMGYIPERCRPFGYISPGWYWSFFCNIFTVGLAEPPCGRIHFFPPHQQSQLPNVITMGLKATPVSCEMWCEIYLNARLAEHIRLVAVRCVSLYVLYGKLFLIFV